ncbi:hypothetical protein NKH77_13490 [Streptomyces sp. M19]
MVADLPVPVAPSSTTPFSSARMRRSSSSMAAGWSPLGWKGLTTSKGATLRSIWDTGRMFSTVRPTTDNRGRAAGRGRAGRARAVRPGPPTGDGGRSR